MEDDNPHPHLHRQQHEYGVPDLRQLMTNNRHTHFPGIPQAAAAAVAELFPGHHHHRHLTPQHHYEMLMMPRGLQDFNTNTGAAATNANNSTSTTSVAVTASVSTPSLISGFECEAAASFGGDGGNGRWPRQETLTLLEIRSRLDSKFKEANQKGPLWDEVSRILSEEHGYQRSGKKCREKFENLYKYYKKTKEGKAGRQDGKHYRFFRQLEALYGDSTSNSVSAQETHLVGMSSSLRFNHTTSNQATHYQDQPLTYNPSPHKLSDSLSLSNNSSESDPSSSDDNDLSTMENDSTEKRRNKKRGGRRSCWKAKIKEFIDSQMRKLMDKQEAWLEKLTKTLEQKEQERVLREEEWRRLEQARIDREHKFWAKERAWIEARDASLMEALQNLTGKQLKVHSPAEELMAAVDDHEVQNNNNNNNSWTDSEITRLIQLRTNMEARFQQSGSCDSEEALWEEIASKMICLGYGKNGLMCKDKWVHINRYMNKTNKKRKENNSRSSYGFFQSSEGSLYTSDQGTAYESTATARLQLNDSSSPGAASNSNVGNAVTVNDSCFRFLMADGDHLWENFGLKLNNGENQ